MTVLEGNADNFGAGLEATQSPGEVRVIKRDGRVVAFDRGKIHAAVTKAYVDVQGAHMVSSAQVRDQLEKITDKVVEVVQARMPSGGMVSIEEIQDQVELALMRGGEHKVARSYVLYREEHARAREAEAPPAEAESEASGIRVQQPDGSMAALPPNWAQERLQAHAEGLPGLDLARIAKDFADTIYDGVPAAQLQEALVLAVRALAECHPSYGRLAARLTLEDNARTAFRFLGVEPRQDMGVSAESYREAFQPYLAKGVEQGLLDERLQTAFNLDKLAAALKPERDANFDYLGALTLHDRYLLHVEGVRFELPQLLFMRVAMGLSLNEDDPDARAVQFYDLLSSFDYMTSTPTLFNSGTRHPQLSSCYLTTVSDDLDGIFSAVRDNAMLSKWAGGLGNDWTNVRAMGSRVRGTNGTSLGVVPFLRVVNDTAVAVNQGGKRKGAVCCYLETWHMDIKQFLELRKNTGDERYRTHDMNTANWVPDLFMQRVFTDGPWTLFSPSSCPDLHDLYGQDFARRYEEYEERADRGEIPHKRMQARELWREMLSMLFSTGHPWITFKDVCNLRSPQGHDGVVHSSNLCTEITLNTKVDTENPDNNEIAVCNLGSINLANHTTPDGLDEERLRHTVTTAVRMLDNVIDINYYPVEAARRSNMRHRPVGLGLMGFQDALYIQDISYASDDAVRFADESMETISWLAISASCDLAEERGSYQSFKGSLWSQGVLPIDSIARVAQHRPEGSLRMDTEARRDWDGVRERARKGMRNSNVMAIAPTATISNIVGVSQSIEPMYENIFVKKNLSGDTLIINPWLVRDLEALGLWDDVMISDLKYHSGSLSQIERIPQEMRAKYQTAFEVPARYLVEAASRRQKWLDQAQSLNIYLAEPDGDALDRIYRMAWLLGLKTTYYLRSKGASTAETDSQRARSVQQKEAAAPAPPPPPQPAPSGQICNLEDPDCEACT